jgi:hypothetical protein
MKIMRKINVAVCITGRLDFLKVTGKNLKRNVLDRLDNPDIFIYHSEMGEKKLYYRGFLNTANDIFKKLKKILFPEKKNKIIKKININEIRKYLPFKKIKFTKDRYLSNKSKINVRQFGKGKESYLQMIYALFRCNKLVKEYEIKNNIKYDFKLRLRADVLFIKPIPKLRNFSKKKITVPFFHNKRDGCGSFGKFNDSKCIHDRFAFGPSDKMDILLNQYNNIKNRTDLHHYTHAEHLLYHYLNWNGLSFEKKTIEKNKNILFLRIRKKNENDFEIFPTDCGCSKRRPNDKKNSINCDKYLKDWKNTGVSELI